MKNLILHFYQVAELKTHMPMEMLRMIKRSFKDSLGEYCMVNTAQV